MNDVEIIDTPKKAKNIYGKFWVKWFDSDEWTIAERRYSPTHGQFWKTGKPGDVTFTAPFKVGDKISD